MLNSQNEIELMNVSKSFKGRIILKEINLKIPKGCAIGFVGSNGSGKSVLFKLIVGLIKPDQGEVYIKGSKLGEDFDFPDETGILIDKPGYIDVYDGFNNLSFLANIKGKIDSEMIRNTMELVGLDPDNKTKVRNYSMGMKQKLGIAQAIMEGQNLIILDEPFNALDAKSYGEVKDIIKKLRDNGSTVLLTSHNYNDIEEICDLSYIIIDSTLEKLTDDIKQKYSIH
ncbi:MAG: ATP-binding cassette domain-containing protein [Desmonostoc geniculatum HA4340-LM1]|jgi:ABC-2 type transport system ATP-binding protein|nr:ATP-binding cassette domain-containing protein [Desmonostoc geniculatum HA4340-LM1]